MKLATYSLDYLLTSVLELQSTVEELEVAEDYNLESPPPEGFEGGVTY